mgnify:CR=1 FL=1
MTKVLVVEDEQSLREPLVYLLQKEGYDVIEAEDGLKALTAYAEFGADIILLDLMLPGMSGNEVCRNIRTTSQVPIIMLTAKGDEVDRIVGLEMGADDYLPKPFNPRELVARINAVLRRQAPKPPPGAPTLDERVVRFGQVEVNLAARTLTRNGQEQVLTTGEFSLLRVLLESPRVPLSRDKLMELARGREYDAFDRSIDVQMSRLRKLVEDDPAKPRYLQTVWGFGYVFVPDGTRHA